MWTWLKGVFSSPKTFIKLAVDSLDLAVPFIASEFEKLKGKPFAQMTSIEQAQKAVDVVQDYLKKQWKLGD